MCPKSECEIEDLSLGEARQFMACCDVYLLEFIVKYNVIYKSCSSNRLFHMISIIVLYQ